MTQGKPGNSLRPLRKRLVPLWGDNRTDAEPVIMTRLVRGRPPGREFDIAFWQAAGPTRIFEAAWDLVVTAAAVRASMKINSDFKDLLRELNAAGVRYPIVGGYAVMVYTEPRYTKELDIWIEPTESNARKLLV